MELRSQKPDQGYTVMGLMVAKLGVPQGVIENKRGRYCTLESKDPRVSLPDKGIRPIFREKKARESTILESQIYGVYRQEAYREDWISVVIGTLAITRPLA